jgi:hypothetical protein
VERRSTRRQPLLPQLAAATGTSVTEQPGAPAALSPLRRFAAGGSAGSPVATAAPVALAALGLAAWAVSVGHIHPYSAGAFGLVTHLTALWWLGLVLVSGGVALALVPSRPRAPVMLFTVVAFAFVLHGTLPAAESTPRFEAAYTVAGFAGYIAQHGHTLPRLDARMSWYGLLSGDAMASRAMQVSTMWFLRWAPLVFELAYLFPVKALANATLASPRARYAVLPLFLAGNWIDQDYFSPQAVALLVYLVVLVVAVRTLGAKGLQPRPVRWLAATPVVTVARTWLLRALYLPLDSQAAEADAEPTSARTRAAFAALLLFLVAVMVITHELTPPALCIVLFFLFLIGRTRMRTLWLFTALAVFAWLSWAAEPFWSGHLSKLFGSVGGVTSTFSLAVTGRAHSGSLGRSVVEASRLVGAAVTWLVAAAGTWVLWRRRRTLWSLLAMAVAPIAVGGAVSYGGEVALRILLFSLAPLAILAAALIDGPHLDKRAVAAFVLAACALIVIFPIARFGNESFEAMPQSDIAATNWIYGHVPHGSTVLVFTRDEPLLYRTVGDYKTRELGLTVLDPVSTIESALPRRTAWIFLTRTQKEDGTVFGGLPKGWMTGFERKLGQISFVHVQVRTATAVVYRVASRVHKHHVTPPKGLHHHPRPVGHAPKPKPPPVFHHLHQKPTPTTKPPKPRKKSSPTTTTPTTHPSTTTTSTTTTGKSHVPSPFTTTAPAGPPPTAP